MGKGQVVYLATYLTADLVEMLQDQLFTPCDVSPLVPDLPPGIEVSLRSSANTRLLFVLNTRETTVEIASLPAGQDLLTGDKVSGKTELKGYGCMVIELA